jgi:hypothetical protein
MMWVKVSVESTTLISSGAMVAIDCVAIIYTFILMQATLVKGWMQY